MPGLLSWVVKVIRDSEYEASDVVPGPGSNIRRPLRFFPSLHRVLWDQFPGFISTMRRYDFLSPILPRFVSFAWQYLGCTRSSLLDGRVHRRGLELVTRFSSRELPRKRKDLPSSWKVSIVRLHMFQSDSGRTACTRPFRCNSVALGM